MLVAKLTQEQKDNLVGQLVQPSWKFNPVLSYGNVPSDWVISTHEVEASIYPQNSWVKNLPLIEFVPKPVESENHFNQFFSGTSLN
jgi:hypothetical protein